MTDRELLEALFQDMQTMKADMQGMKDDMQGMKDDMQGMKDDMQGMKDDMQGMKDDMQTMKDEMAIMKNQIQMLDCKVTKVELTMENDMNRNIQILAENHINIVDKLNESIRVQDKSILYEVQVSGLNIKMNQLEREIAEIKAKIA